MHYKKSPVVVIDCYGFIYRAYHVQPKLSNPDGQEVGTVYGFINMITKILIKFSPKSLIAVFDSPGKNHRSIMYPEYKNNRPSMPDDLKEQIDLIKEATQILNMVSLSRCATEADDIIASFAEQFASDVNPVIVISSDKDLYQLVNDNVSLYSPTNDKLITEKEVIEKFGVNPGQIKDYLAIVGDTADNIPGVKGIGAKGARDLINKFDSLDNIFANVDQLSERHKKLLIQSRELAYTSQKLVELLYDIDLEADISKVEWKMPKREVISAFLIKHQFRSLFNRMNRIYDAENLTDTHSGTDEIDLIVVNNIEQFKNIFNQANKVGSISIFIEKSQFLRIYLSYDNVKCYLVNLDKKGDIISNEVMKVLVHYLSVSYLLKIVYDIKTFLHILHDYCDILYKNHENNNPILHIRLKSVEDLLLSYYAMETRNSSNNDVKSIISHMANMPDTTNTFSIVPKFSEVFCSIKEILIKDNLLSLYYDIDLPLHQVIFTMERIGVLLAVDKLKNLDEKLYEEMIVLEKAIFQILGREINLASPKQVSEVLFNSLDIPKEMLKLNKSGSYSTSADILDTLSGYGIEVARLMLNWRKLHKLKTTYTDALVKQCNKQTSRIHTIFSQVKTHTARLNSVKPNLQNIPAKSMYGSEIRSAFISSKGYKIITADYSQMELRLLSHIGNIIKMQNAFQKNIDIHSETAAELFDVNTRNVTLEQRNKAKTINFGIIYGISSFGLAKQLKIGVQEAKNYIDKYFEKYEGIKQYMQNMQDFAKIHGYVRSIFNRKCSVIDIGSNNYHLQQFAQRVAINAPIQSSASDITRVAMIKVCNKLAKHKIRCNILLQIHDELLFECAEEQTEEASLIIKNIMERVVQLEVPLIANVNISEYWKK